MVKDKSDGSVMSSFALLEKAQRFIMMLMVPFVVIWLLGMAVVFAMHMPYMLLSYPLAGVAVWIYRQSKGYSRRDETEQDIRQVSSETAVPDELSM